MSTLIPLQQKNLISPVGAFVSAAITTNTTTAISNAANAVFAGLLVNAAGSSWTAAIYNGDPSSSGVLLTTISADAVGPVVSPLLRANNGIYVVTSGTTPGSVSVAYYA
jgi:hypothetical protein